MQNQESFDAPACFAVARSYLIQMQRGSGIRAERGERVASLLDMAESQSGAERNATLDELNAVAAELDEDARLAANAAAPGDARRLALLADAIRGLTASLR
ncbi:MAG: hypothetical protein F4Z59_05050 [Gemmatimonadales bacterium]|nr:hypothetical protein [Gemmatimonadales bacterium]